MNFNKALQLLLICALALSQTIKNHKTVNIVKPSQVVAVDEILSYECARSIASIANPEDQMGPLFASGELIFTSVEAEDKSQILIVNAGAGNFVLPLENNGVNRIRFEIPSGDKAEPKTFYLSYLPGITGRSRFFEFSADKAPVGQDELDYSLVPAQRSDLVLPHLDYAISVTADTTFNALVTGHISREQLAYHRVENCEHIARVAPNLGANLRRKLEQIDLLVAGPAKLQANSRMPASIR